MITLKFNRLIRDVRDKCIHFVHSIACIRKRRRLTNKTPTIISNNCVGGIIYYDLGLPFNSPTINLYFEHDEFITYVTYLEEYSKTELFEDMDTEENFPIGVLRNEYGEVRLYFMHFSSFEEAKEKWEERTKRIDFTNIFIIMDGGLHYSKEDLEQFDNIKYKNKIILTNGVESSSKSSFPMSFYDETYFSGKLLALKSIISRERYLDEFDYVSFLNASGCNENTIEGEHI
ncbi:DUF1919 domain-containing protein [Paenibacillus arenosi]|uniref:DUF1919 domain-containing protein n=1 Tax=Paenibacillus arenosi TaxID=2774142 RepID=A0ABR9B4A2_9BACL|nr:DUF1919 domain-containing protein [Paenibacillus arenosi]MBD8501213.1 DUF1919 domain-containing protein [Paenibacillus arenosi]